MRLRPPCVERRWAVLATLAALGRQLAPRPAARTVLRTQAGMGEQPRPLPAVNSSVLRRARPQPGAKQERAKQLALRRPCLRARKGPGRRRARGADLDGQAAGWHRDVDGQPRGHVLRHVGQAHGPQRRADLLLLLRQLRGARAARASGRGTAGQRQRWAHSPGPHAAAWPSHVATRLHRGSAAHLLAHGSSDRARFRFFLTLQALGGTEW